MSSVRRRRTRTETEEKPPPRVVSDDAAARDADPAGEAHAARDERGARTPARARAPEASIRVLECAAAILNINGRRRTARAWKCGSTRRAMARRGEAESRKRPYPQRAA